MPVANDVDLCAAPDLTHLRRLTTDLGIWQHTIGRAPDEAMGYSIDDVARALIAVNHAARLFPSLDAPVDDDPRTLTELAEIYLRFLERYSRPDGRFRNFVAADGSPRDRIGSDDSQGRTIWALGETIACPLGADHAARAEALLTPAEPHTHDGAPLRTRAFGVLGLSAALSGRESAARRHRLVKLVRGLVEAFDGRDDPAWEWFEDDLRYSNGMLPLSLLRAAAVVESVDGDLARRAVGVGCQSLDFLLEQSRHDALPAPIGSEGWYPRGGPKALYSQQPVDAAATILAALEAWAVSRQPHYRDAARTWLGWYEGCNTLGLPVVADGGVVFDGLEADRVSNNCGAESVVTYILARLRWIEIHRDLERCSAL